MLQMGHEITAREGKCIGIRHIRPFSREAKLTFSERNGKPGNFLKRAPPQISLQKFRHDRCPVPLHNAINRRIHKVFRCTGGVDTPDNGMALRLPSFDSQTKLLHLIHPGDV
jgi:hypothetical protein